MKQKLIALAVLGLPTIGHAADAERELGSIIVTATRTAQTADESLQSVTVITRKEIEQRQVRAIDELLRGLAGVDVARNGGYGKSSSVYLRGANAGHVLVLVDGVRAGSATLGTYAWQNLSPDQIERIEIVRGPRAALYGSDAIGGVIQIFTRKVRAPFVQAGIGSHGTREVSAGIGGGERWRYSMVAGHFSTDGIPTNVSFTESHGYQNGHFAAGIEGELAAGVQLRLDASHAQGSSEFDANTGNEDFRNQVFSAQLSQRVSEQWTQRLTLGHALDRYETFSPTSPATISTSRNSLAWQHDLVLHQGGLTTLGLDFWRDDAQKNRSGVIDQSLDTTALFAQHQWQALGANWLLGLRHDRHERFGSKTTGHIAWGLDLSDELRVTASYGTAFKAPTVNDLFWPYRVDTFAGTTYITEGNPDLNPETSRSLELGLAYKPSAAASMAINLYRTQIDDLIEWQSTQTGAVEYTYRPANVSTASIKGAEMVMAVKRGNWDMGATLTWQKAEDDATGRQLDRRPQRKVSLSLGHPIGRGHIQAEWLAASERNDRTGSVRLDGYGIVNLAYRRPLADQLELQARVENLFDKDYVLASSYSGDYNSLGRSLFLGLRYSPK